MKKVMALFLLMTLILCLFGCAASQQDDNIQESKPEQGNILNNKESPSTDTTIAYNYLDTYEELSQMPAEELFDLFIQNGLVINNDLKASFTDDELQKLFKDNFHLWHTGVSAHSDTMYIDLAEQTKVVYEKIVESKN